MQLTHSIALDFGRDTLPITILQSSTTRRAALLKLCPLSAARIIRSKAE